MTVGPSSMPAGGVPRGLHRIGAVLTTAFYLLKPLIPRSLQLAMRRAVVRRKRARVGRVWPIDEMAGAPPEGWPGWPQGKRFALVLTHDVETAGGRGKCRDLMRLEQKQGFVSSFNFVPRRYETSPEIRFLLADNGFEVGVHGLYHDGKYYRSREKFRKRAVQINRYLREWNAVGFRTPCMFHNLEWIRDLDILYDASTFDTDPFEPQPDGMGTIYPFRVGGDGRMGYVELPYTLPQDFTLFILMRETDIGIWKRKLAWIAEKGGMALLNTHPDYMALDGARRGREEYPGEFYEEFLDHVKKDYRGLYWHVLPREVASFVASSRTLPPGG